MLPCRSPVCTSSMIVLPYQHPSFGLQGSAGAGALRTATLQSAGGVDPRPQGANIGLLQGVRIATPFFGTGYNFCIGAAPLGGVGLGVGPDGAGEPGCIG